MRPEDTVALAFWMVLGLGIASIFLIISMLGWI